VGPEHLDSRSAPRVRQRGCHCRTEGLAVEEGRPPIEKGDGETDELRSRSPRGWERSRGANPMTKREEVVVVVGASEAPKRLRREGFGDNAAMQEPPVDDTS
jgi:hypothetical protein